MVDEISKIPLDQLSKYVSPEFAQGAAKGSRMFRYKKITSNLMKQITVKLNRLGRHISKDEWVHDNAVAKELDKRLTKLESSIKGINKDELRQIASDLKKIEDVASNFLRRKKITQDQDKLLKHLESVIQSVEEMGGPEATGVVNEKVRAEPKAKETAVPVPKPDKGNETELRKIQKPAQKSNLSQPIKQHPTEKSGQITSIGIFQLQKNLNTKKSEYQEKLSLLRTAALYTAGLQKELSEDQKQVLDKIKKEDIAGMDVDQMAEFYEELVDLIGNSATSLPKSHKLPDIEKLLTEIPTLHEAISELEEQIHKLKNTMASAPKPIKSSEIINVVKKKLDDKKFELQKKLIQLSTEVFDTSIGIKADKLSNKLDENQRSMIENIKKQVVESMDIDQIEESYDQLLSLIEEAHLHMLKTMKSYEFSSDIEPLMTKIDDDIISIRSLEKQLTNLQK